MFKKLLLVVLLLAVLIAGLIASAPLYLPSLASRLLESQGVVVNSIQLRVPSANSWIVTRVELQTIDGLLLEAETLILRFTLPDLLKGRLDAVDIESLIISRTTPLKEKIEQHDDDSAPITIRSPQQWLTEFPLGRVYIRQGLIDEKITIQAIDFQVDEQGLRLDGLLNLEQQEIVIKTEIGIDDSFSFSVNAGENQLQGGGQISSQSLKGSGSGQLTVGLLKPWLPADLQALSGMVNSSIDFSFDNTDTDIETLTNFSVQGNLTLADYFERLEIDQALTLSGSIRSPTLLIHPGDAVTITRLLQPVIYDQVIVGLSSALELQNLDQGLNVDQAAALRLRSDKDELDVVFSGNQVAINGQVPSITPGFYLSSDLKIDSFSPLSLSVLQGAQVSFGRIGSYGNVVARLNKDLFIRESNNQIQLDNGLSLNLTADTADTSDIVISAAGELSPLSLSLKANSDNLVVDGNTLGNVELNLKLAQLENQLTATLESDIVGLEVNGSANFGLESQQGTLALQAESLRQLNEYLSPQCVEISRGDATLNATFDLRSSLKMSGQYALNDLGLRFQDAPYNGISVNGAWSYTEVGDDLRADGKLSVPELNIGVLLEDFNAELRYQGDAILIDKVQGQTLGGRLYGVNLRWYPQQARNDLQLYLDDIDLKQLVALEDYEGLDVSGKINASLPLVVDSAGVQVVGGSMEAVQPGGVIHLPVDSSNSTGNQKDAFEALQNFHFETLSGGVSGALALDPNGLLVSDLTLRGTNPDMGRLVSLNLNIEVPTYPIFQTLELFDKLNRMGQCSN